MDISYIIKVLLAVLLCRRAVTLDEPPFGWAESAELACRPRSPPPEPTASVEPDLRNELHNQIFNTRLIPSPRRKLACYYQAQTSWWLSLVAFICQWRAKGFHRGHEGFTVELIETDVYQRLKSL